MKFKLNENFVEIHNMRELAQEKDKMLSIMNKIKSSLNACVSSLDYSGDLDAAKYSKNLMNIIYDSPIDSVAHYTLEVLKLFEYSQTNDPIRQKYSIEGANSMLRRFYQVLPEFNDLLDNFSPASLSDIEVQVSDDDWGDFQ